MDVGDEPGADGLTAPLRLHNLLLALAGRVDDSMLSEAHELIARADTDEAAELTAGTLIAGRIPVRAAERRELADVLEKSRSDATLVDDVFVDELVPMNTHRFTGDDSPESGLAQSLERTVRVLPDVRSVRAVWRTSPAGAVPGPLPQRVVLVEVGGEAVPPAVAYRVEVALRKSGAAAVVDVLNPWTERTAYHESALASSRLVWSADTAAEQPSAPAPAPARTSEPRTPPGLPSGSSASGLGEAADAPAPSFVADPSPAATQHGRSRRRALQEGGSQPHQFAASWPEPAQPEAPRPEAAQTESASSEIVPPEIAPPEIDPPEMSQGWPEWQSPPPAAPEAEPGEPVRPEQPWYSGHSWQLAKESGNETGSQYEPRALPEGVDLPPASEPTWSSAFQEPDTDQAEEPAPADQESRAASTTEMTPAEMSQLRQALAEDPDKGREIAATVRPGEVVEIPELDLNDPQLSDRDRELLRELHAELAARERAEAARSGGVNGSQSN